MNISFKKDFSRSYMVIEKVRDFSEQEYMVKMLLKNEIPQLLKAEYENLNGQINMLYDISSRQVFFKLFEVSKMSFEQVRNLIFSLRSLLRSLQEYLLDENDIILKKECIFTDPEGEAYEFCFFPYYNGNLELELKELFSGLLSIVDPEDEKAVRLVHEVHSEVQRDNVTIDSLLAAYERASERELPLAEKESWEEEIAMPSFVSTALSDPEDDFDEYEEDSTFFERARLYLKGKHIMDVLEDINNGEIMEKIRSCGKMPQVPPAYEPASLPVSVKPDFEYIMLGEDLEDSLAEDHPYMTHSLDDTGPIGKRRRKEHRLEGRKEKQGISFDVDHLPFTIGKASGSDALLTDPAVSRIHARLYEENGVLFLEDLNSTNGTYVNGTPLEAYKKAEVCEGDILRFAQDEFCLR